MIDDRNGCVTLNTNWCTCNLR